MRVTVPDDLMDKGGVQSAKGKLQPLFEATASMLRYYLDAARVILSDFVLYIPVLYMTISLSGLGG